MYEVLSGYANLSGDIQQRALQNLGLARSAPQPMARPALQMQPMPQINLHQVEAAAQLIAQQRAEQIAQQSQIAVSPKTFARGGEVPAGFKSSATVAANDTVTINVSAPVLFKPKRLLIPGSIAPNFELVSCVVGMDSQLVTSEAVPCESFTEESLNQGWRIETLQIGQAIQMVFRNISSAPVTLRGAWLGLYAT